MTRKSILHHLSVSVLAVSLGGCGVLESDRPAEHNWWLEPFAPTTTSVDAMQELGVSLAVVPGLDTDHVLTLDPDARLNYFAGARWVDHVPEMLESLVVRSMENAGLHARVSARHSSATGACHLDLEVRRFYARIDAQGSTTSVEIEMGGYYGCGDGQLPVTASASVPVSGNRMPPIIAAYQRGLDQVMAALLEQM